MVPIIDFGRGPVSFFNGTPHAINLVAGARKNPNIRKWQGGEVIQTIPPSGIILDAQMSCYPVHDLGGGVLVSAMHYSQCDELPALARKADYVIASLLYCKAYRALHKPLPEGVYLVSPADMVVAADGRTPIGCRGFALN